MPLPVKFDNEALDRVISASTKLVVASEVVKVSERVPSLEMSPEETSAAEIMTSGDVAS